MWTLLKLTFLCRSRGRRGGRMTDLKRLKLSFLLSSLFALPQCYCCVCVEMNRQHNTGIRGQPVTDQCPVQVQKRFTAPRPHPQVSLTSFNAWLPLPGTRKVGCWDVGRASDSLEDEKEAQRPSDGGLIQEETGRTSGGERDGREGAEAAKEQAPRRRAFW